MIVGGAKSASCVSVSAPTAWPELLRSFIASWTSAKASRGSRTPTGSGAHIVATRLPSAPLSASARTDTGTIARSSRSSVLSPRPRIQRPSASATAVSTTSLTVPPSADLMALKRARSASTHV